MNCSSVFSSTFSILPTPTLESYWMSKLVNKNMITLPEPDTSDFNKLSSHVPSKYKEFITPFKDLRIELAALLFGLLPPSLLMTPIKEWNREISKDVFLECQDQLFEKDEKKDFFVTIYFLTYAYKTLHEMLELHQKIQKELGKKPFTPLEIIAFLFQENSYLIPADDEEEEKINKLAASLVSFFKVIYQKDFLAENLADIIKIFHFNTRYMYSCEIEDDFNSWFVENLFEENVEEPPSILTDELSQKIFRRLDQYRRNRQLTIKKITQTSFACNYSYEMFEMITDTWILMGDMTFAWEKKISLTKTFQKLIIEIREFAKKHYGKKHQFIIDELAERLPRCSEEEACELRLNLNTLQNSNAIRATFLYKLWWYYEPFHDAKKSRFSVYHRGMQYIAQDLFGEEETSKLSPSEILEIFKTRFETAFPAFRFDDARGDTFIFEYLKSQKQTFF